MHDPVQPSSGETFIPEAEGRRNILDVIDGLRSLGLDHYIDLPQVVVCGDQSSGKSSVLEAISGINFPRKDNLCTRFATELVLRRSNSTSRKVSIVPGSDRSVRDQAALHAFSNAAKESRELERLIEDASKAMGIDDGSRKFSKDILRLEVSGPHQAHLTLVDLPGLFRAGTRAQSDADAEAVDDLVRTYMRKSRAIILAVVSAKNDLANQIVTKYAREEDPNGLRTLGIITKPDTLFTGSESERLYYELAENRDVYFRHGWHVLKNRDYGTRHQSTAERDADERQFFSQGLWSLLPREQVGVEQLRLRLSTLLHRQILSELPSLLEEVDTALAQSRDRLKHLGSPRDNATTQRLYLLTLGQRFTTLMRAAVEGNYSDPFFGTSSSPNGTSKRLRAVIQNTMIDFARTMREKGHAKHIIESSHLNPDMNDAARLITRDQYIGHILDIMRQSRGKELPGTYNPTIIGELFQAQCQPWPALFAALINTVFRAAMQCMTLALLECTDAKSADKIKTHLLGPKMATLKIDLDRQANTILQPHISGHPITYNHYFTENVQKVKLEHRRKSIIKCLDRYFGTDINGGQTRCKMSEVDIRPLLNSLTSTTTADMDRYACSEIADCMRAYYKVALKTVIDEVATLCIERCLLAPMQMILDPDTVVTMPESQVSMIATEPAYVATERSDQLKKLSILEKSSSVLHAIQIERFDLISEDVDTSLSEQSSGFSMLEVDNVTSEQLSLPAESDIRQISPTEIKFSDEWLGSTPQKKKQKKKAQKMDGELPV